MKKETMELFDQMDELINEFAKNYRHNVLNGIDEDTVKILNKTVNVYNKLKEYYIDYADQQDLMVKTLTEINEKLDNLSKVDKA